MSTTHWRNRDALLLPDSGQWGRGYGGKPYTSAELEETRVYIMDALAQGQGFPGYENRGLIHKTPGFLATGSPYIIPPGFDAEHPGRSQAPSPLLLEPNNPTSLDCLWRVPRYLEEFYRASGADIDQHGRWVHPLGLQVMEAGIPLCTGYGVAYEGGETVVVDTVVEDGESVLFNSRQDGGRTIPSLVGGYTWATDYTTIENWRVGNRPVSLEGIHKAVRRIVRSKAGIELPEDAQFEIAWGIRPWSSAHTLHFGTVTYTVHVRLSPGASRHLTPNNDSYWQTKQYIASVVSELWPDHRRGYSASMGW